MMSTAAGRRPRMSSSTQSAPRVDARAGLLELLEHRVEVLGRVCCQLTRPPVIAPATRYVPLSMRSGITS